MDMIARFEAGIIERQTLMRKALKRIESVERKYGLK